jgi:putative ABC transport system ATP-binding protein
VSGTPEGDAIVRGEDLTRHFRLGPVTVQALRGVNFSLARGEFVAIMGASGCGKSTLMNIIGLLDRPTSGQYFILGQEVGGLSDADMSRIRNQAIGFVFQSFHLLPKLTACENVELPLVYRGTPARSRRVRAREMLDRVNLWDREAHHPSELSGGQQQRVAIARALVGRPEIILADEPTGALDPATTQEIMDLFTSLNREDGMTILLITHDVKVASLAGRVIRLQDGRIVDGH